MLAVYYAVPSKVQWIVLLCASMYFYYVSGGAKALLFILAASAAAYAGGLWIDRMTIQYKASMRTEEAKALSREEKGLRKAAFERQIKWVMRLTICIVLGMLIVLKYSRFIISKLNIPLARLGIGSGIPIFDLILPLGISFYTLSAIGYVIDIKRGKYHAQKNPLRFILYVSYFPHIIQGPIARYDLLGVQFEQPHKWDTDRFKQGVLRMLWGYFKKVVVSAQAAIIVNEVFGNYIRNDYKGLTVLLGGLMYGVQIFCDFSGGMDIVMGASEMFGISLTENFRQPIMARSVSEFWQRWHMTLGAWMKDYIFYSITFSKGFSNLQKKAKKRFGNYYGKMLPAFMASFAVFMLVGIWHGAESKYIVYGVYHAILVSTDSLFERIYGKMKSFCRIQEDKAGWKGFQILRTIYIITMGRYLSHAGSVRQALSLMKRTFAWNPWVLTDNTFFALGISQTEFMLLLLGLLILLFVDVMNERGVYLRKVIVEQQILIRWLVIFAAIAVILIFGRYGAGYNAADFIYGKF